MTTIDSLDLAEDFAPEDHLLADARRRAKEVGVVPVRAGAGAALQFLAAVIRARAIAEIGTGTGLSGLRLLRGMGTEGVLTSVDLEAEHQRHAREVFLAADIPPQRFRLIAGAGLDVMTRLTDGAYDMVFLDGDKTEYGEYLDEALRLVRPGGIIAFDNALWHDRVADPSQRDPETTAIRELLTRVKDDDDIEALLLPLGDGVLAVRAPVA
jgi:predicted O-methyltransferase YrrM